MHVKVNGIIYSSADTTLGVWLEPDEKRQIADMAPEARVYMQCPDWIDEDAAKDFGHTFKRYVEAGNFAEVLTLCRSLCAGPPLPDALSFMNGDLNRLREIVGYEYEEIASNAAN